jgi:hypothetical protein
VPFLDTPDSTPSGAAIDGILKLERRQSDAEIMLDRGDFPLRYLGNFDLTPMQSICVKTRGLLRRQVETLAPKHLNKNSNNKPTSSMTQQVTDAVVAMTVPAMPSRRHGNRWSSPIPNPASMSSNYAGCAILTNWEGRCANIPSAFPC